MVRGVVTWRRCRRQVRDGKWLTVDASFSEEGDSGIGTIEKWPPIEHPYTGALLFVPTEIVPEKVKTSTADTVDGVTTQTSGGDKQGEGKDGHEAEDAFEDANSNGRKTSTIASGAQTKLHSHASGTKWPTGTRATWRIDGRTPMVPCVV